MAVRRNHVRRLGAAAGLALTIAGCSAASGASPAPATPPAVSASATAQPTAPAAPSPSAEPVASAVTTAAAPTPAAPATPPTPSTNALPGAAPEATLDGLDGGRPAGGELGSYTWAGGGSDAPWIVGPAAGEARRGATLTASFGGIVPATWTASWAPVAGGAAGDPAEGTAGSGPVTLTAPATGGDWSLSVSATFGPGANATYFWHLAVTP